MIGMAKGRSFKGTDRELEETYFLAHRYSSSLRIEVIGDQIR